MKLFLILDMYLEIKINRIDILFNKTTIYFLIKKQKIIYPMLY